jgi:glycerol kinase
MRKPLPKGGGEGLGGTHGTGCTELCQDFRGQTLNLRVIQQHFGLHLAQYLRWQRERKVLPKKEDGTKGDKMESRVHTEESWFLVSSNSFSYFVCKFSHASHTLGHPQRQSRLLVQKVSCRQML